MHLDEKTKDSSVVYDGKIFKIKKDGNNCLFNKSYVRISKSQKTCYIILKQEKEY